MANLLYRKPYIDSDVFIGVIKNEIVGETVDGKIEYVERGKIGAHVLTLAEQRVFPIYISPLTIAEVHKIKHQPKLTDDENENILEFFENDFVTVVPIDREDGESANRLCRQFQGEKLSATDALHLACALKAGCDVLLTWIKPSRQLNLSAYGSRDRPFGIRRKNRNKRVSLASYHLKAKRLKGQL